MWISTFDQDISTRFDVDAFSVSVDQTGSVVALDTNKGLLLITLDRPDHIANIFRHKSAKKHRVVRWNPHSSASKILALSDGKICKVWDVRKHKAQTMLKQHTALISDMCWSHTKKNIIATCSKDSHTLVWDIRSSKRSVKCVASTRPPPSKVSFHPNLEHILATANGPDISIWDTRKSSESVNTFRAHSVAGVDDFIWLGVRNILCSSTYINLSFTLISHKTKPLEYFKLKIKFSHSAHSNLKLGIPMLKTQVRNELGLLSFGKEEKVLKLFDGSSRTNTLRQTFSFTSYPLQQVLRVPFSRRFSLLTTSQRGDHRIRLWTNNLILEEEEKSAVDIMANGTFERCHAFTGHSSTVVSCDWRIRGDQRQIVSWSTDRHLSLWQVHDSHLRPQGESREVSMKRPEKVVIQTASPKVEPSKSFAFDRNSDGFTLSAKKYSRKSVLANSLKNDADEAEDDVMVRLDKLDDDDFSQTSSRTEQKTFGSLLSFRNAHHGGDDAMKRGVGGSGGIMNILKMTSTEKTKQPILSPASSSDTRHRPCPPCGTIALFDKSNVLILFNLPTTTPRRYESKKTYESFLSFKLRANSSSKTNMGSVQKSNHNDDNDNDSSSTSVSSSSSSSRSDNEESNDAMSLLLMIDESSQNLPLSHPGNIVATSMRGTAMTSSAKTMSKNSMGSVSTKKSEALRDVGEYFADSDSDASSIDDDDLLFWRRAFGPQHVRPIADPDHSLDVVTFQNENEITSTIGPEISKETNEDDEEEEEFSLDGGNRSFVKEVSSPSIISSEVSLPVKNIIEETSKPSSSSSSVIKILDVTHAFPELDSYGRIRYDLYTTKAQDLCSRNVNICKELHHGALSKRCWTSLMAAFGEGNSLSPIVASTLPLMCNMLCQRQKFESVVSLASLGMHFVSRDKMRREDREVLRSVVSSFSDASFRRREDMIAHTFLRRAASVHHDDKNVRKDKEDDESKHVVGTPGPPPTPPILSSPHTSPRGRLRRLFSRSLLSTTEVKVDATEVMDKFHKDLSSQKMCSLCRLPARGLVVSCSRCGCGGHISCLRKWFESEISCPSGCDCRCSTLISTDAKKSNDIEDNERHQQQKDLMTKSNELSEDENEDTTTSDEEEVFDDESTRKVEYSVMLDDRDDEQEDFLSSYALKWGVGGVDSEW